MNERNAKMQEMTMKKRIEAHGGLFDCAFKAKNGRKSGHCLVRAHNAREARRNIRKAVGCALVAFLVKAVCP